MNEPMAIFYGAMKGSFLAGALGVIIEEWETIKEQLESFVGSLFFFVCAYVCVFDVVLLASDPVLSLIQNLTKKDEDDD